MMQIPVSTTSAYLPSRGLNERRCTKHVYSHSEIVTLPARVGAAPITGLAHLFRCSETGELRRWGFDASYRAANIEPTTN